MHKVRHQFIAGIASMNLLVRIAAILDVGDSARCIKLRNLVVREGPEAAKSVSLNNDHMYC